MINIISSRASSPNTLLKESARKSNENNLDWLNRYISPDSNQTVIVLVGGKSVPSFRLRVAQSHLRHDLLPSYWSHVILVGKVAKNIAGSQIYEISLEPPLGFRFPTPTNGIQTGKLGQYRDAKLYPNIAMINVPLAQSEIISPLKQFQLQRAVLDAVELIVRWLSFAWGVARASNPLLDGYGIPSAAMLEIVFGAAGYELTPGLESRSSCPEAIWQAAKWWHAYYEGQKRSPMSGAYAIAHEL